MELRKDQKATLGCGTLILIALIVLFFGNKTDFGLKQDLQSLKHDMFQLKSELQFQSQQIQLLQTSIDKLVREAPKSNVPKRIENR